MATESPKQKSGGMAYEVILAPASSDAAPLRPGSPPKERPLSAEDIERKLELAEERRQAEVAAKLALIAKDKERAQEAVKRVEILNNSFSKTAEKRLSARFEAADERKDAQIKELQDRLKEHAKRVDAVRSQASIANTDLLAKIESKMEKMGENRTAQLNAITERIKEHEKHVQDVLEASSKFTKLTEQKSITKMETTLKNREDQLLKIKERLQDHDNHVQSVRAKKLNQSLSEENITSSS
jgi:stathmin